MRVAWLYGGLDLDLDRMLSHTVRQPFPYTVKGFQDGITLAPEQLLACRELPKALGRGLRKSACTSRQELQDRTRRWTFKM